MFSLLKLVGLMVSLPFDASNSNAVLINVIVEIDSDQISFSISNALLSWLLRRILKKKIFNRKLDV